MEVRQIKGTKNRHKTSPSILEDLMKYQPITNIGTCGHVAHGKTTLVNRLTGIDTKKDSKEKKMNKTINLGYANTKVFNCLSCNFFTSTGLHGLIKGKFSQNGRPICPQCSDEMNLALHLSFIDTPGHSELMNTMCSGCSSMDGALLIISATEKCPQLQTKEHCIALSLMNCKNVIVIQNKVDLVSKERAIESYKEIKNFTRGTFLEHSPVIPISAQSGINLQAVVKIIHKRFKPSLKKEFNENPRMQIIRSFDINKPGCKIKDLKGGVIGGALVKGTLNVGDEIEIRPGKITIDINGSLQCMPLRTKIQSIRSGNVDLKSVVSGGLFGICTNLDPFLTRANNMVGMVAMVAGKNGKFMDDIFRSLMLEYNLFKFQVGKSSKDIVDPFKLNERIQLILGSCSIQCEVFAVNFILSKVWVKFLFPKVGCSRIGERVAILRDNKSSSLRLIGFGIISNGERVKIVK